MRSSLIAALMTFLIMAAGHTAVLTAKSSTVDAALEACAVAVGLSATGKPDMEAIHACMAQKGFHRPNSMLVKFRKSTPPDDDDIKSNS